MGFNFKIWPYEISKSEFYSRGGFASPSMFRIMRGSPGRGYWVYYSY